MCGRFVLQSSCDEIARAFAVEAGDLPPRYNIAPSQDVAAVRAAATGPGRQLVRLKWGLLPSWAKDKKLAPINAMAETVADKPFFRAALRQRRCLIPASGFYEWSAAGKKKQPYYFTLKTGLPFAFAGLWERWQGDGEDILSCTLITTQANDVLRPYHHRMPVIVPPAAYVHWLDPAVKQPEALAGLLQPYPAGEMLAFPVATRVNSPTFDDPRCIEPLISPPALA
jgi:putative SOS response-associated peptidase YedK